MGAERGARAGVALLGVDEGEDRGGRGVGDGAEGRVLEDGGDEVGEHGEGRGSQLGGVVGGSLRGGAADLGGLDRGLQLGEEDRGLGEVEALAAEGLVGAEGARGEEALEGAGAARGDPAGGGDEGGEGVHAGGGAIGRGAERSVGEEEEGRGAAEAGGEIERGGRGRRGGRGGRRRHGGREDEVVEHAAHGATAGEDDQEGVALGLREQLGLGRRRRGLQGERVGTISAEEEQVRASIGAEPGEGRFRLLAGAVEGDRELDVAALGAQADDDVAGHGCSSSGHPPRGGALGNERSPEARA